MQRHAVATCRRALVDTVARCEETAVKLQRENARLEGEVAALRYSARHGWRDAMRVLAAQVDNIAVQDLLRRISIEPADAPAPPGSPAP
jgi:hypothetical protein